MYLANNWMHNNCLKFQVIACLTFYFLLLDFSD